MLSPKRRKFASEYVKNGFNGVQAVFSAGYKQGYQSACTEAYRLLRIAEVRKRVEDNLKASKMDADEVLERLAKIARLEADFKGSDVVKANELLGKGHKLFTDKVETVDLTQHSATESALLKSINSAAKRDDIQPESAAIQLFQALSDDPALCDLSTWPEQFRPAIQSYLQSQAVVDAGDSSN